MASRIPTPGSARGAAYLLAIAFTFSATLIGCGSEESTTGGEGGDGGVIDVAGAEPLGEQTAGSVAQLAQCRDWNRGDEAEKLATIADIRSQVNPQDSGFDAPPLSDQEAMELFEETCKPDYAQGFRLYILYARGAAFAPVVREP
jgi:hypothetical protein